MSGFWSGFVIGIFVGMFIYWSLLVYFHFRARGTPTLYIKVEE